LAQRAAAVGLTDRGSLSDFALMADRRCGVPTTVVVGELGGLRLASLGDWWFVPDSSVTG
jgi:hypothetical protein